MTTPVWEPGTLYQPGSLVTPRSFSQQVQTPPTDPGFESGTLDDWTVTPVGGAGSGQAYNVFQFEGTYSFLWAGGAGSGQGSGIGCELVNDFRAPVLPGQSITASCRCMSVPRHREHHVHSRVRIYWYNESNEQIAISDTTPYGGAGNQFGTTGEWVLSTVTAAAPAGAAFASIGAFLTSNQGDDNGAYVDDFQWNYVAQTAPEGLVFRAVQDNAGYSGAIEPAWPVVNGQTVVDNEVTWEATTASRVVWEATPLLVSGAVEPTFPLVPGATVQDNTIAWVAMDHRVKDEKCPHSKIVAIAASKVFAADGDIVGFSATVNPLDWSTANDAGYIPFGLHTYGANAILAMGLYRSNLMVFNEKGYQMWQVDQDPRNMALLDAVPIGSRFHRAIHPVSNDLAILTDQGIRNIGIAGASANAQAGFFGKQIDPLVVEALKAMDAGDEAIGLFWPGAGQYWLFFGDEAFVLTMNGDKNDMSWSRYQFPAEITDWTLHNGKLLLRAGDLVWEMDEDILGIDDYSDDTDLGTHGTPFEGYIAWPYLDFGPLGIDKELEGIDVVATGEFSVSIGYNQNNEALATAGYTIDGDTLVNAGMIPFPLTAPSFQFRLTFTYGQFWEWSALNVYIT